MGLLVFVVSVMNNNKYVLPNTAVEADEEMTYVDLFELVRPQSVLNDYNYDSIVNIEIREGSQCNTVIEVSPSMKISTCKDLNCKFVQYKICGSEPTPVTTLSDHNKQNAF